MYTYKLYNSITEIDKKFWDTFIEKNNIMMSHDFLQAVELSEINDCKYYYIIFYDAHNTPIALFSFYIITTDLLLLNSKISSLIVSFIRKIFPMFMMAKAIECGSPVSIGKTFSFNSKENIKIDLILNQLIRIMTKIGKKHKADFLLFRDFYKNDVELHKMLQKNGLYRIHILPDVEMQILWDSFDDYMNSLRYNYRRNLKKYLKTIEQKKLTLNLLDDYTEYVPRIRELYYNCYIKAKEYKREILTENFFYNIHKYLPEKSKVLLIQKDDLILGYALFLLDDYTLRLSYIGLDYNYNEKYSTYFILFYHSLKYAIENKYKKFELGLTSYDFKQKMGGEVVSLYAYMKHLNPVINIIMKKVNTILFPPKKVYTRNPFKK